MHISGAITDLLVALPSTACYRAPDFKTCCCPFSDPKNSFLHASASASAAASAFASSSSNQSLSSLHVGKLGTGLDKSRTRDYMVRASEDSGENNMAPIGHVLMETLIGKLVAEMLQTQLELLPAAIDLQLEMLQSIKEEMERKTPSSPLYPSLTRRIAEVSEENRRTIVKDLIYCSILHSFMKNNITMIPKLSPYSPSSNFLATVYFWPNQLKELESVHSPEAFYMIQSYLSGELGDGLNVPLDCTVKRSKIELGRLYESCTTYGYFLRNLEQRYRLEIINMEKTLPEETGKDMNHCDGSNNECSQLNSYAMSMDPVTLDRLAAIRSEEALSLMEKHMNAMFGQADTEEEVYISVGGEKMLALEGVAFGSFLWEAESRANSKYRFMDQ